MQKKVTLKVLPSEFADEHTLQALLSRAAAREPTEISGYHIIKKSIDARSKTVWINLTVNLFINEPIIQRSPTPFIYSDVTRSRNSVIIIGAGPAGLFAALALIEQGIKPIILERGNDVRARRRDLAILNKQGIVNPDSNYCFGEGGAGTYSDGKLYTRSSKRGDVDRILNLFVNFGADESILYEAHPHIGTNKLPQIITAMRRQIIHAGGEFLFQKKVVDIIIDNENVKSVKTADGNKYEANAFILATGHSARDVFILLKEKKIALEAKPFALGVRVEHPQSLIDTIQYRAHKNVSFDSEGQDSRNPSVLPPASYNVVAQVGGKGVFSFCMCPGGIIAPASTQYGELVVNGWSPSKRNNPFANSGMVVQVEVKDALQELNSDYSFTGDDPLLLMHFQKMVEEKAFTAGGGNFVAPAVRMVDFCEGKISSSLPVCSYLPGVQTASLKNVLPGFIYQNLQIAFKTFGKKMKGYYTNEALVVATESRTSSPVRIPRDSQTLTHPQVHNLYPCGEGAGYAGGIMSAAMDGEKVALRIAAALK